MNIKTYILLLLMMACCAARSQKQSDSLQTTKPQQKTFLKQSIVPLSLIGAGVYVNYAGGALGKENLQENIREAFPDFETSAEDFLMFVPVITMYTADLLKVESKNDAFTQTKYLGVALVANNLITFGLKNITKEERPNGEDELSFPSGHTSNAFVMATVLFHEFRDSSPLLAYSGFLMAATTGTFRVLNNDHWVSDVLVGAGIGIIVTDLVYRLEPLKNWNPFKKKQMKAFIGPSYFDKRPGIYANIQF